MMKKNNVCKGLLFALAAGMLLTGCGKSEAEKAAEYYEEQYGMSQETAEELANTFWGNEEKSEKEEKADKKGKNEFKLYEALPEMKNSKLGDGLVQIHDVLIYENAKMTAKEVLDALNKGAEADNYYYFTGREETKLDYLVNPNSECYINLYYGNSHSGENLMCSLNCYNPTDDYLNLEDCTLIEVKCSESYSSSATAHCFNVIGAGNVRFTSKIKLDEDSEFYDVIAESMLSYDNYEEYLLSQGYGPEKRVPSTSGGLTKVSLVPFHTGMSGEKEFCYYTYDFKLSNGDRKILVNKRLNYSNAEGNAGGVVYSEQVSQEVWDAVIEEMKADVRDVDTSTLVYKGKMLGESDPLGTETYVFFEAPDNKCYLASQNIFLGLQGNLIRNWVCSTDVFDSLDAAIANVKELHGEEIRENTFQ